VSLINRPSLKIGRAIRELRDDRVFVIATDDTYAPEQYFKYLPLSRIKFVVLPTPQNSGLSSPGHVVERLKEGFAAVRAKQEIQAGDEFWVFLDTDHHTGDSHLAGTLQALQAARQAGFEIALSNPCFEVWLLLHHTDVSPGTVFGKCDEVVRLLRQALGSYDKTAIKDGHFRMGLVADAIRRARALESSPDAPEGYWPSSAGSRVYRLLERALKRD
jgi:hypothetical protein